MKKRIMSLVLCMALVFGCCALTACSYNWEKNAAKQVEINVANVLKGKTIDSAKAIGEADEAMAKDIARRFLINTKEDKAAKAADTAIELTDTILVDISAKQDGTEVYTSTALSVQINKVLEDTATTDDMAAQIIATNIKARLDGSEETKVGGKYTFTGDYTVKTEGSKKYLLPGDVDAKSTEITYTITDAVVESTTVEVAANDIVSLFYQLKKEDAEHKITYETANNLSYAYAGKKMDGTAKDFYLGDETASDAFKALFAELVGKKIDAATEELAADTELISSDWLRITVTSTYPDTASADETATIKVGDLSSSFTACLTVNDEETRGALEALIISDIKARMADTGESATKVVAGGTYTIEKTYYIDSKNNAMDAQSKFYTAESENVEAKTVTITYNILQAHRCPWSVLTFTDTADGTVYTFQYRIAGVGTIADNVTLEKLKDSSVANSIKAVDGGEDTIYLYLYTEEKEDNGVKYTEYTNNYFGEFLFRVNEAGEYSDKEGKTLKTPITNVDVVDDATASTFAIEKTCELFIDNEKQVAGANAIWALLLKEANITVPKKLLDDYYKEYYQNNRYTFYVTNNGTQDGFTDYDEFLMDKFDAETKEEVRAAIDALAAEDLKPRLLLYAVAEQLNLNLTKEEKKNADSYLDYLFQMNNYNYSYYYSMYGNYASYFGYNWYNSVDDYMKATYGSKENYYAGCLVDKVLKELYDNAEKYEFTLNFDVKTEG